MSGFFLRILKCLITQNYRFKKYSELNFCHFEGHKRNNLINSNFPKSVKKYTYEYPGKLGDNLESVRKKSINDRKIDLDRYIND